MARPERAPDPVIPPGVVPPGTTELGIDIVKVERIAAAIERFGQRFADRVLTPKEQRYVRQRPETFAGRWAAKESVSKVLGLGVRGVGWRDIEVERLPTGQPNVILHGRAAHRGLDLPRGRVRRGRRLRGAHGRGEVRVPARHRRPPGRPRAQAPRAHGAAA
jgi:holo-[acyl-carrier protein] synthase